jgi:hypothetical protein
MVDGDATRRCSAKWVRERDEALAHGTGCNGAWMARESQGRGLGGSPGRRRARRAGRHGRATPSCRTVAGKLHKDESWPGRSAARTRHSYTWGARLRGRRMTRVWNVARGGGDRRPSACPCAGVRDVRVQATWGAAAAGGGRALECDGRAGQGWGACARWAAARRGCGVHETWGALLGHRCRASQRGERVRWATREGKG